MDDVKKGIGIRVDGVVDADSELKIEIGHISISISTFIEIIINWILSAEIQNLHTSKE